MRLTTEKVDPKTTKKKGRINTEKKLITSTVKEFLKPAY